MKLKLFPNQKVLILIIFLFLIILILLFIPRRPTPPSPTPPLSPPPSAEPTSDLEFDKLPDWNQQFDQQLDRYLQEFQVENQALAKIRQSAPLSLDGFIIDYSYQNNTYTITITKQPYDQTKNQVLDWFKNQGITHLDYLRLNWINS